LICHKPFSSLLIGQGVRRLHQAARSELGRQPVPFAICEHVCIGEEVKGFA
jgi:hypothetical protein